MEAAPRLPQRDLWAITGSLTGVTLLSWWYLWDMARGTCHLCVPSWDAAYFLMMFWMWVVMMAGMMLPSATPMILIYAAVARKARNQGAPIAPTGFFTAGYLLMWTVFSFAATLLQWWLDKAALLSPEMTVHSPKLGAVLLIAAGIYQCLPVKNRCLEHCQSPFHFISNHWQSGNWGAFVMGASHGIFCLGCCWVLMLLLFVGGVMNLLWIAAITAFVLLEKIFPLKSGGRWAGIMMIVVGLVMLLK
jgi:predicted metal-binding membrane protein